MKQNGQLITKIEVRQPEQAKNKNSVKSEFKNLIEEIQTRPSSESITKAAIKASGDSLCDRDLKTLYVALLNTTLRTQSLALQGLQALTGPFLTSNNLPLSAVLGSLETSLLKSLTLMTSPDERLSLAASDFVNALCHYLLTRGLLQELIMTLFDILSF